MERRREEGGFEERRRGRSPGNGERSATCEMLDPRSGSKPMASIGTSECSASVRYF